MIFLRGEREREVAITTLATANFLETGSFFPPGLAATGWGWGCWSLALSCIIWNIRITASYVTHSQTSMHKHTSFLLLSITLRNSFIFCNNSSFCKDRKFQRTRIECGQYKYTGRDMNQLTRFFCSFIWERASMSPPSAPSRAFFALTPSALTLSSSSSS